MMIPEGIRQHLARAGRHALMLAGAGMLAGCAGLFDRDPPDPPQAARTETFFAVTTGNRLISFNVGQPGRLLSSVTLSGLRPGEEILGIDSRVARIRVVSDTGQNLRLHPDTGAVVDPNPEAQGLQIDAPLACDKSDIHAGTQPTVIAAAFTCNKKNETITTNYAIDAALGTLVMQGSRDTAATPISPDTGRLFTMGATGVGPIQHAAFDIADLTGTAFLSVMRPGAGRSGFYPLDLDSSKATYLARIEGRQAVRAISFEP